MKKLLILLFIAFNIFVFADWDVDPDASTFTADSLNAGKLVGGQVWILGDSLFFTDGGADTNWIVNTGTQLRFGGDNPFYFVGNTTMAGVLNLGGYSATSFSWGCTEDTIATYGTAALRGKEVFAKRLRVSSPDKSDTGTVYYDANDTLHIEAESGDIVKIENPSVIEGDLTVSGTETINIETATADTGLVITIDSIPTGGGGDVTNIGLLIKGTSFKDATQKVITLVSRDNVPVFYINAIGNVVGNDISASGILIVWGRTNLGNAATDTVLILGDIIAAGTVNYAEDAQSDDDYEVAIPGITALTAGLTVTFKANTLNTGGATLEITSVGDIDVIAKRKDQVLATGDIKAGQIVTVVFDGSMWQMTSQLAQ